MGSESEGSQPRSEGQPGSGPSKSDSLPPSSSTTPSGGYNELNGHLRSVLQHPVGLPLVCFLNDFEDDKEDTKDVGAGTKCSAAESTVVCSLSPTTVSATTTRTRLASLYSQEVSDLVFIKTSRDYDAAFAKAYESWNPGTPVLATVHEDAAKGDARAATAVTEGTAKSEKKGVKPIEFKLTKALSKSLIPKDGNVKVKHQFPVQYHDTKSPGNIDLVLYEDAKSLLLAAEFGIRSPLSGWWKKAHQNARYVKGLVDYGENLKKEKLCVFADPMLFAVVDLELDRSNVFASALLGVFLCWPATTSKAYRVALLWRTAPTSVDELSAAFGRTVRAATLLPKLLHLITVSGIDRFKTLGPNCCRIKDKVRGFQNVRTTVRRCPTSSHFVFTIERTQSGVFKVLRSYDSRFRPTARRSDLYDVDVVVPGAERICLLPDKAGQGHARPRSGEKPKESIVKEQRRNHLFDFSGALEIIASPFLVGKHYASSPDDFIPVVKALQDLHTNGYVHGDIRCFNIIFGVGLIDFDFGGKVGSTEQAPTYPEGFNFSLVSQDGYRHLREVGGFITMQDDAYAMTKVIFHCHDFLPPEKSSSADIDIDFREKKSVLSDTSFLAGRSEVDKASPQREVSAGIKSSTQAAMTPVGATAASTPKEVEISVISGLQARLAKEIAEKERLIAEKETERAMKKLNAYRGAIADDPRQQLTELLDFLEKAKVEKWTVQPADPFRDWLKRYNLYNVDPRTNGKTATGSPNQATSR
jgi:hypothetical protein